MTGSTGEPPTRSQELLEDAKQLVHKASIAGLDGRAEEAATLSTEVRDLLAAARQLFEEMGDPSGQAKALRRLGHLEASPFSTVCSCEAW